MKIAVIGSGGREHAIIKKLQQSAKCDEIYALPGNGGMEKDAICAPVKAVDIEGVTAYCRDKGIEYVVVAPDDPLALGMVDALAAAGIPAFGPSKAAARIEASKVFAKDLMRRYRIPTAAYESFDDYYKALAWVQKAALPLVIKADGLALGKGVLICHTRKEAEEALRAMMQEMAFGISGSQVVVEEFLTGPEVSVLAFCDGQTLVPMVSSMDHKRALDGDEGLNTGGMGTVAPNPFYTPAIAARCMREIFLPTVRAMRAEGCPFKGCLYFGLMLTEQGPKVIEYNCRFGDPETQVVLPLLQSDLLEIFIACTEGRLTAELVRFSQEAAACVIMASGGYPGHYKTGVPIRVPQKLADDVTLYFAGAALQGGALVTAGGRVLGVTATAPKLESAVQKAYAAVENIHFADAHYRSDIGQKALQK